MKEHMALCREQKKCKTTMFNVLDSLKTSVAAMHALGIQEVPRGAEHLLEAFPLPCGPTTAGSGHLRSLSFVSFFFEGLASQFIADEI